MIFCLHGRRHNNISGQLVPLLSHPYNKEVLSGIQTNGVAVAHSCAAGPGHYWCWDLAGAEDVEEMGKDMKVQQNVSWSYLLNFSFSCLKKGQKENRKLFWLTRSKRQHDRGMQNKNWVSKSGMSAIPCELRGSEEGTQHSGCDMVGAMLSPAQELTLHKAPPQAAFVPEARNDSRRKKAGCGPQCLQGGQNLWDSWGLLQFSPS